MNTLNPGNTRTFTLSEEQTADVIDSLNDRIEALTENESATDLHTAADVEYFHDTIADLRTIVDILEAADG